MVIERIFNTHTHTHTHTAYRKEMEIQKFHCESNDGDLKVNIRMKLQVSTDECDVRSGIPLSRNKTSSKCYYVYSLGG
jgi:hypothetical protein